MPGALLPLRVLVSRPKVVELDSVAPGLAQFTVLKMLKASRRSCTDALPVSFVVLNTDKSTVLNDGPWKAFRSKVLKVPAAGFANADAVKKRGNRPLPVRSLNGSPTCTARSTLSPAPLTFVPVRMLN